MVATSSFVGLAGSVGSGHGESPVKYAHRHVTFMALPKRILKMAQLKPLYLRQGMFARSFSMVVGVMVAMKAGLVVGDTSAEVSADRGSDELEGLDRVVASWAGPITY